MLYLNIIITIGSWMIILSIQQINEDRVSTIIDKIISLDGLYRETVNCARLQAAQKNIQSAYLQEKKFLLDGEETLRDGRRLLIERIVKLQEVFCTPNRHFRPKLHYQRNVEIGRDGPNWVGTLEYIGE